MEFSHDKCQEYSLDLLVSPNTPTFINHQLDKAHNSDTGTQLLQVPSVRSWLIHRHPNKKCM